jgi:hypothetical protein
LDSLVDPTVALSVQPTIIFFSHARYPHHPPRLWFASQIRHQRPQQPFGIDTIRLGLSRSPVNLNACRIDHMIANAASIEQPVQPEPTVARLLA